MTRPVTPPRIDLRWTVNEVLLRQPAAVSILHAYGIDACCGGGLPLEEAARRHGVNPDELLAALATAGAA